MRRTHDLRTAGLLALVPGMAIALWLAASATAHAQDNFEAGQVTDPVTCTAEAGQSYALYLPPGYDPARKYPTLFGFSPGANGRSVVNTWLAAAERFGWIIVASNNSRNGAAGVPEAAMEAMWKDVPTRVSMDRDRVYSTGLSGGSRVALMFALTRDAPIAGVFNNAAAGYGKTPDKDCGTLFVTCAGVDDYNLAEFFSFDRGVGGLGLPHVMVPFAGGHQFPPRELSIGAMRLAEIAAAAKRGDAGTAAVQALIREEVAQARDEMTNGPTWWVGYERLVQLVAMVGDTVSGFALKRDIDAIKGEPRFERERESVRAFTDAGLPSDQAARIREVGPKYQAVMAEHPGTTGATYAMWMLGAITNRGKMAIGQVGPNSAMGRELTEVMQEFPPASSEALLDAATALIADDRLEAAVVALYQATSAGWRDAAGAGNDARFKALEDLDSFAVFVQRRGRLRATQAELDALATAPSGAPSWDPARFPEPLGSALEDLNDDKWSKGVSSLRDIAGDAEADTLAREAAAAVLAEVEALATARVVEIESALAQGLAFDATEGAKAFEKDFDAFPGLVARAQAVAEAADAREYRDAQKAGDRYHRGLEYAADGRPDKARRDFEYVIEKYGDTAYAALAQRALASLEE